MIAAAGLPSPTPRSLRRSKPLALAVAALMTGAALSALAAVAAPASAAAPTTYYIDPTGLDTNAGTSPSTPWRTVAQVNKVTMNPGDQVLLLRGATWTGRLYMTASGTASAPISVGAYGTGALPKITGGANGDCVRIDGSYVTVDSLNTVGCSYDGFNVFGKYDKITNSQAANSKVGIKVSVGAAFGSYQYNTLTNINLMNVNTQGTNCGTAQAVNCNDDSGATAFLVSGDDNDFGFNTVTGSNAASYDYGRSGSAFALFNANRNAIHDNTSADNLAFSSVSRSGSLTSDGNSYNNNTITASCGVNCNNATGIALTGGGAASGPNTNTVINGNTFDLVGTNTKGISCSATCPASTVVTNNTITTSTRAIYLDGSGWTLTNDTLQGATVSTIGTKYVTVPMNTGVILNMTANGLTSTPTTPPATGPVTYYVDPAGSDSNNGTSAGTAWQTLTQASNVTLHPGDQILLIRGGTWTGRMNVLGSGTSSAPVSLGAYGSGALPKITGGSNGDCVSVNGDYVNVDSIATTSCGYDGFGVYGQHDQITNSTASDARVGIKINAGAAFGSYEHNSLTNINIMNVNTLGTNCGTDQAVNCSDDSGATAFLINGDDNDFGFNTVTGSNAFSYDYGRDGSAFEIFNANRNVIHDNTSIDNLVLSELGRGGTGTADGNQYRNNTVSATCGDNCTNAGGITLRGNGTGYGPNTNTVIDNNTFSFSGSNSFAVSCSANCPSSTVVTNNTISAATRSIYLDSSGWTLTNNTLVGATVSQIGPNFVTVPLNTSSVVTMTSSGLTVTSTGTPPATGPATYYVDPAGADTNNGTSPTTAWKTLTQAGNVTLHPGDQILFLRGATWSGRFNILGSGTSSAPITVGAYGTGALPIITTGSNGDCVRINGDYVTVDSIATTNCGYDGFGVYGKYDQITNSAASNMKVGIKVNTGATFGSYEYNTLTNVNIMNVLTPGTNCGTAQAVNCTDDSGATAFLINGDDNDFGHNTVTGSNAFSYDYGRSGSAFALFNANRNLIHDNTSTDNLVFSNIARSGSGTAAGNSYRNNSVSATCGANCTNAGGITLSGANPSTVMDSNTINLTGSNSKGITCSGTCASTTVVTNNTLAATRVIYLDGSGWTVSGNTLQGATVAQIGTQWMSVPAGSSVVR